MPVDVLDTELRLAKGNYAIGFSTDKRDHAVRFQGFHAPKMLIILDEAPGIPAETWGAIDGIRAGGDVRILALGNPTVAGGPFYEAFTSNRAGWKTFTIDAFDTPNFIALKKLAGGDPDRPAIAQREVEAAMIALLGSLVDSHPAIAHAARPYLVTPRWAQEMLRQWGVKSPWWQSRVRGQFPEQGDDALFALAWLLAAKERQPDADCEHRHLDAGVDVAGPGSDETAVFVRCNDCSAILDFAAWSKPDPRGDCVAFLNTYEDRLDGVNVDSIGIGYNFGLHLEDEGLPVNLVNVGKAAKNTERFANQKAEAYWGLRERFETGEISGLVDEITISQLATIRYQPNPRGQIRIESKDDLQRRGVKSPDRAEALMLTYSTRTPGIIGYYRKLAEAKARGEEPEWEDENSLIEVYQREYAKYSKLF